MIGNMNAVREALSGIPGSENVLMRYEDGGAVQVFLIGETEVRVDALATVDDVRAAFSTVTRNHNG